ncbi:MAG: serine/threonine protein kinase, partial [Luteimonas sp.]|nr:serine/threonine protein kinase [Luteimonas sp.]
MTTSTGDDPDRTELLATRGPTGTIAEGDDALAPGARLGRYRIEALLGRGGMGEVYRAEQLEPVRRTVALKLLHRRRLDARHLAYFEVERQLLAQMRHPAIAQVFDADTTDDGHPFFAMEFIAGSPLTRFCEEHALSLRQRIELMIRVCEGVQHAHQKGVVHRDLKPGNLLVDDVDGRALPKIIDFGIATASSMAEGREAAGTPDYMSPEQAAGDQSLVDTRSDVYSLGVVLYEVLTGQRPEAMGETRVASTQTLRLPSEQLATLPPGDAGRIARGQGLRLADMRRVLRHELDWVVARAMRHDRSERYASAGALADDLQRFLDGRPLAAVPPSRGYVWGKFVRRHRLGLVAASVAQLALRGGLGMSLDGLQQARAQRHIAEQRSAELEKVAAFQQSMLEGIDIEAMGIGMAEGLRGQAAKATPAAR